MIPTRRGEYLEEGLKFPYPTGHNWRCLVEKYNEEQYPDTKPRMRRALCNAVQCIKDTYRLVACAAKAKRTKAVETALKAAPKTIDEAYRSEEATEWVAAANLEFDTLTAMGVVDHNYSLTDLRKLNITRQPIKMSVVLDNKTDENGEINRRKVRMAVAGHKYNMTRGIDYDEVFSAAPNQNTTRLIQAMAVDMNLQRKAWDIKLAYCWSELPRDQWIALKYPEGFERVDPKTKEPLFMLLKKNCYGLPQAGRLWSQTRDKFMMEHFNKGRWTCHRCTYDPCLFYIQRDVQKHVTKSQVKFDPNGQLLREYRPAREEAWVVIHTDDCDAVGTSKSILNDIFQAHDQQWQAKCVTADYMLGIKRQFTNVNGIRTCKMSMTAFVEGMANAFKEYLPTRKVVEPFKNSTMLYKHDAEDDEEMKTVQARGYSRAVGMLMWATRGAFPECQYGMSQLTKVMSCPSEKAWKQAMQMIQWMYDNKDRGIIFSSIGNDKPVVFSDASNKPDIYDGLSHYGFCLMFKGGPIASTSKKLAHVGLSSFHNEYMAMRYAASYAVWFKHRRRWHIGVGCHLWILKSQDPRVVSMRGGPSHG